MDEHASDMTEFLNEVLHLRASEALEKHPHLTAADLLAILMHVLDESPARPNTTSMNAILCALQKLPHASRQSMTDTLDTCVRVLDGMQARGIHPDDFSYSLVYRMCAMAGSAAYLRVFEARSIRETDSFGGSIACTSLICARGKLGELDGAQAIADDMRARGVRLGERAYSCLMSACHRARRHADVLRVFRHAMGDASVTPTEYLFSSVFASCGRVGDMTHLRLALRIMRERGVDASADVLDVVFGHAVRAGDFAIALSVLTDWRRVCAPLVVTRDHCVRLLACVGRGGLEVGENAVEDMWAFVNGMESEFGLCVDLGVMNAVMSSLVRLGQLDDVHKVLNEGLAERGLRPDVACYNSAIRALGLAGQVGKAVAMVDEMVATGVQPDQVTYNSLLEVARTCGNTAMREAVLKEIERNPNLKMDMIATTVILKGLRERRDGGGVLRLHVDALAAGTVWDAKAYGLVLSILFESGRSHDAIGLFGWLMWRGLDRRNMYNVMMHHLGRGANGYEICEMLLRKLRGRAGGPDEFSYTSLIKICSRHGRLDRAFKLVGEMQDVGVGMSDRFAWTAVIDGCGRDGRWERGIEVLRMMRSEECAYNLIPTPTTACYNAALYAAGIHGGDLEEALKLFQWLREDGFAKADAVSFSAMASIFLRHRRRITDMAVVEFVLSELVGIVKEEVRLLSCRHAVNRRGKGTVRFAFGRRLDEVEVRKLQAKIKRLSWLVQNWKNRCE